MALSRSLVSLLGVGAMLAAVPTLAGADKVDLERATPVPANQPIPVADFFREPLMQAPVLNRAGTHFAALSTDDRNSLTLLVHDLNQQKSESLRGPLNANFATVAWLDDAHVLCALSRTAHLDIGMMAAKVGNLTHAYPVLLSPAVSLVGVPDAQRMNPLLWIRSTFSEDADDYGEVALIRTDLDTGPVVDLLKNPSSETVEDVRKRNRLNTLRTFPMPKPGVPWSYLADGSGELAFSVMIREGAFELHRFANGIWEKSPIDPDALEIVSAGEKPGQLVVRSPLTGDKPRALEFMDAATGQPGEVLLEDPAYDFNGMLYRHPVTHQILGLTNHRVGPKSVYFTEGYRAIQKVLEGFFPGLGVRLIGSDTEEKRFFVEVQSDRQPISYYWVDLEKRSLGLIKATRPWLDPARMRPITTMKYKTSEGRQLDAYVTLPAGASKTNPVPLVVLPPHEREDRATWGFDSEAQFFASRGYAVLQPNHRASAGYRWMFPFADTWAMRKIHDDVTAATKTLLSTGLIDAKRVAIVGSSFAGYLAASGVAFEPGMYRCAVVRDGVNDWGRYLKALKGDPLNRTSFPYWRKRLGDPKENETYLDEISPYQKVAQIRVPVLIASFQPDFIVGSAEPRRLADELKRHDVPYEFTEINDDHYGLPLFEDTVEFYTRVEAFLARNLTIAP